MSHKCGRTWPSHKKRINLSLHQILFIPDDSQLEYLFESSVHHLIGSQTRSERYIFGTQTAFLKIFFLKKHPRLIYFQILKIFCRTHSATLVLCLFTTPIANVLSSLLLWLPLNSNGGQGFSVSSHLSVWQTMIS